MYSLYADTVYGYNIKVMSDVLQNSLGAEAFFEINNSGIYLCNTDNKETVLINIALKMENFEKFVCERPVTIAITIKHLNKLLKNVKKKDSLTFFIDKNIPNKLGIKIIPISYNKKMERAETSYITFREINHTAIEVPDSYHYPKVISTTEYQKMCKRMNVVPGKVIHVKMYKNDYISFFCDGGDVISAEMEFGELPADHKEEDLYRGNFYISMLSQFVKIPGLAPKMQISAPQNNNALPLRIRVNVGSLGLMEIFLKTKEQIDYEQTKVVMNE